MLYNVYVISKNYLKKKKEPKVNLAVYKDFRRDLIIVSYIERNLVKECFAFTLDEYKIFSYNNKDINLPVYHQLNIDEILDRINEVGIDNITNEEKQFLENLNDKK